MISRDPDITRLPDRLEARSLVTRERSREDRRVVMTRIVPDGLRNFLRDRMGRMDRESLSKLIGLLEQVRELFRNTKENV